MTRRLGIAIVVLALTALPARADGPFNICGPGGRYGVKFDARFYLNVSCYGPGSQPCAQLAPWYLYWPMDAHFQAPAPITYPFWPAPQTPMGNGSALQPAGYQQYTPSYWYAH